jgi:hypothetical protein
MLSRVFDTPVADVGFNVVLGVVRQEECEKRVCMGEAEEAKKAVVYPPEITYAELDDLFGPPKEMSDEEVSAFYAKIV